MTISTRSTTAACALALSLGACAKSDVAPTGPRVAIDVAPLTLPNVVGVEYGLAVFNASPSAPSFDAAGNVIGAGNLGALVWTKPSVTSIQYGNGAGGDVAYVGTCDASEAENWVALVLRQIAVAPGAGSYGGSAPFAGSGNVLDDENSAFSTSPGSGDGDPDFSNPCDFAAPCVLKFRCAENEDTAVEFNLTIMRDAEQGFFDVAVNFADVFCSTKVDTCYAGEAGGDPGPIKLLFNAAGERVETAVIAGACSAGPGEESVMWMAPIVVTCDDGVSFTIDPTGDSDVDPTTPGLQGNHSIDAERPGAIIEAGAHATGTFTLSVSSDGAPYTVTVPAGTPLSATDGRDYVTVAATTIDTAASNTATVSGRSAAEGAIYNGATAFGSLSLIASDRLSHAIDVSGESFAGGVDPSYAPGTHVEVGFGLYWGDEQLACDAAGTSCSKIYWNVAINLDDLRAAGFENCEVATAITASGSPALAQFANGGLAGPGQTYGYVAINAPLTVGTEPTCFQGPMGSDYAAPHYGASSDMVGAEPFPHLCSYFERGAASPKSLGDVEGYFQDPDSTPADARYAGRLPATGSSLPVAFDDMGGDASGPCNGRVLNVSSAAWFDRADAATSFAWTGSWTGAGDLGAYRVEVFGRVGNATWKIRGGYTFDLRVDEGRAFFSGGATFDLHGDDAVALVVTRTDAPIVSPIGLMFNVTPGQ